MFVFKVFPLAIRSATPFTPPFSLLFNAHIFLKEKKKKKSLVRQMEALFTT